MYRNLLSRLPSRAAAQAVVKTSSRSSATLSTKKAAAAADGAGFGPKTDPKKPSKSPKPKLKPLLKLSAPIVPGDTFDEMMKNLSPKDHRKLLASIHNSRANGRKIPPYTGSLEKLAEEWGFDANI